MASVGQFLSDPLGTAIAVISNLTNPPAAPERPTDNKPGLAEEWRAAVTQAFPNGAPIDTLLWVINHESGGDPNVPDYAHSGHNGLFQVAGGSFDPQVNIQQAAQLYLSAIQAGGTGLEPWGGGRNTYTTSWGPLSAVNVQTFAARGDVPPATPLSFPTTPSPTITNPNTFTPPPAPVTSTLQPVGPEGRTFSQITGTQYVSDTERAWYSLMAPNTPSAVIDWANSFLSANGLAFNGSTIVPIPQPAPAPPAPAPSKPASIALPAITSIAQNIFAPIQKNPAPVLEVIAPIPAATVAQGFNVAAPIESINGPFFDTANGLIPNPGVEGAGNTTTVNNAAAQAAYDTVLGYQEAAAAADYTGFGNDSNVGYATSGGEADIAGDFNY